MIKADAKVKQLRSQLFFLANHPPTETGHIFRGLDSFAFIDRIQQHSYSSLLSRPDVRSFLGARSQVCHHSRKEQQRVLQTFSGGQNLSQLPLHNTNWLTEAEIRRLVTLRELRSAAFQLWSAPRSRSPKSKAPSFSLPQCVYTRQRQRPAHSRLSERSLSPEMADLGLRGKGRKRIKPFRRLRIDCRREFR